MPFSNMDTVSDDNYPTGCMKLPFTKLMPLYLQWEDSQILSVYCILIG